MDAILWLWLLKLKDFFEGNFLDFCRPDCHVGMFWGLVFNVWIPGEGEGRGGEGRGGGGEEKNVLQSHHMQISF